MSDRLFDIDEIPEVPLFREPRGRRGPARGVALDDRFKNDYPPEWTRCSVCGGDGRSKVARPGPLWDEWLGRHEGHKLEGQLIWHPQSCGRRCLDDVPRETCPACLGMGSIKGRVRLEAGHRCVRCKHPFVTKRDAKMLGVQASPGHWSPCDERCSHGGPMRFLDDGEWVETSARAVRGELPTDFRDLDRVEAEWRILTVHHLDGDKANVRWWNLVALCQRCHLEIQARVVMDRVYPHEHSEWFKPYVAGFYAWVYLQEDLTRAEVEARLDELLGLELAAAPRVR